MSCTMCCRQCAWRAYAEYPSSMRAVHWPASWPWMTPSMWSQVCSVTSPARSRANNVKNGAPGPGVAHNRRSLLTSGIIVHRASDEVVCVPIAVSARHAHLSQSTLDTLFGPGYELQIGKGLSQTGQFSAQETVTLIGPR